VTLIGERVDASGAYRDGASTAATQCAVTVINQRRELAPSAVADLIFKETELVHLVLLEEGR